MCRVFSIDLYAFSLFECNEKTSLVSKGRSKAMQVVKQTYQPDFWEARAIKETVSVRNGSSIKRT